ncbi:MAG: NADH-quinone oxidoreductase subunit B [Bdellovibrionaceae bacterium]|nr:NADH-quinone oxidoreductase subunit B [Bdellovibrionales bacterium]MCB9083799.1 NADH-quinone oxidoreductase subunit B [Pseudobdellovibrionaceae bacterium]
MGLTGQSSYVLTSMDRMMNWARANSLWPLAFGTSCCAIEMMMSSMASRHDLARFGAEVVRPTPRQADLLILAGTIVKRMAKPLRVLYEQMPEPRYVIATGACTISGGPFTYNSYTTVRGADEVIPVDVFVPGCPPRPESLIYGLLTLQKMIKTGEAMGQPYKRKRPVTAALPPGITQEQLQKEIAEFLDAHSIIDVEAAANNQRWEKERY